MAKKDNRTAYIETINKHLKMDTSSINRSSQATFQSWLCTGLLLGVFLGEFRNDQQHSTELLLAELFIFQTSAGRFLTFLFP